MPFVIVGLIFVFLLCLLNLMLVFGVIRRLRQHAELLGSATQIIPAQDPTVPVGSSPGRFAVSATDGSSVSTEQVAGSRAIVAFFGPDCSSCAGSIEEFVQRVPEFPGGTEQVIAIVVGGSEPQRAEAMAARLQPVASVVVEPMNGPVGNAFRLDGVPAMCLLDESGVVVATGRGLDDLVVPEPA